MTLTLFDYVLAPTLVLLAWQILRVKDLFVSIVLYILFGLLAALAWVELRAPDIALVEAAIGAGVIGALFLGVLGRMESLQLRRKDGSRDGRQPSIARNGILWGLSIAVAGVIGWGVLSFSGHAEGLGQRVFSALSRSGVQNPVTAVIINFRGYDTLLEIGVLFLVAVAVDALDTFEPFSVRTELPPQSRILVFFLHLLTPMMILVAAYLLWIGAEAPGGAFQAGAVMAGVGILLFLGKAHFSLDFNNRWLRIAIASGFGGFLLIGMCVAGNGRHFLEYPESYAKEIILLIESLAAASIGLILLSLFAGCSGFLSGNKEKGRP
jgi:multisubunit Na+/H+ antiporter MnhB subunit